jgi:hypothetical protein
MRVRALAGLAIVLAVAALPAVAGAQPPQQDETKLGADLRREGERFAEKCGSFDMKNIVGCASTIVTDHPFHLAVGSLAPQNGFGFGLAFVPPQITPNDLWRINWSADAAAAASGAWRGGVYAKFVRTDVGAIGVASAGGGTDPALTAPRPYPTISLFAQSTSLPKVGYFGLGNDTLPLARSQFAMHQSTVGTRVAWPLGRAGVLRRLNPTAIGELNGRWIQVDGSSDDSWPSIETIFDDATAPGLDGQPATLQLGEALRIAPSVGRVQLTYTGQLQQYIAGDNASFRRWTLDLNHVFQLWRTRGPVTERENNSPNECTTGVDRTVGVYGCPDPTLITTNRVGSVAFRALVSRSQVSGDNRIPFYFQRTIGGSDIDGERLLASYDDYRFRGPHLLVLQETFEHVLWGPVGAFAAAEQGRVARLDASLGSGTLHKTVGAGLTLRAGGIPMLTMWWATGGSEGHHVAITMNTSLLGGSVRPSLR